ncbi:MAG: methyltransferase family protein [Gemmobacter sp.]
MTLREMIDLPPVWLVAALAAVWALDAIVPWSLFGPSGARVGAVAIGAGLLLMGVAAAQMLTQRTTVIPRGVPAQLVTGGVFRLSRNPIYLGDALVLAGAILWWDVAHAFPILLAFMALIQRRFILPEEAVLRRLFGTAFEDWAARTGRWIGPGSGGRLRQDRHAGK